MGGQALDAWQGGQPLVVEPLEGRQVGGGDAQEVVGDAPPALPLRDPRGGRGATPWPDNAGGFELPAERRSHLGRHTDRDTEFRDSTIRLLGHGACPGGYTAQRMVTPAAEKAAAERVLRSWRTGRVALSVYGVAGMVFLWILAPLDQRSTDLYKAIGVVLAGGVAVLVAVVLRNEWRGEDLAVWEPELHSPATFTSDKRVHRNGGTAYVAALFAISGFAVLVQDVGANHAARTEGVAQVTGCSGGYRYGSPTCYGRWTVAGRTYSGTLPGVHYAPGATEPISYDPEDPSSLGSRSTTTPLFTFLIAGVLSGTMALRWTERARAPYIAEVERIAAMHVRDDTQ
jgi:hypothetical protein